MYWISVHSKQIQIVEIFLQEAIYLDAFLKCHNRLFKCKKNMLRYICICSPVNKVSEE